MKATIWKEVQPPVETKRSYAVQVEPAALQALLDRESALDDGVPSLRAALQEVGADEVFVDEDFGSVVQYSLCREDESEEKHFEICHRVGLFLAAAKMWEVSLDSKEGAQPWQPVLDGAEIGDVEVLLKTSHLVTDGCSIGYKSRSGADEFLCFINGLKVTSEKTLQDAGKFFLERAQALEEASGDRPRF